MKYKYGQRLPAKVEKDLDAYVERIKNIKWFKPSSAIERDTVDAAVKASLSAFGISASIEYRKLSTPQDWGAAWSAARDAAWDAARDAAWGAAWGAARDAAWSPAWGAAWSAARDAAWDAASGAGDILATHTDTYKLNTPFLKLVDLWEMGLYPCGVIGGKFIVYVPESVWSNFADAPKSNIPLEVIINGVRYVPTETN